MGCCCGTARHGRHPRATSGIGDIYVNTRHIAPVVARVLLFFAIAWPLALAPASAHAEEAAQYELDIAAQELGSALVEYGIQTGNDVLFRDRDVAGKATDGVSGLHSEAAAIRLLLADSGVQYRQNSDGTLLVGQALIAEATTGRTGTSAPVQPDPDSQPTAAQPDGDAAGSDEAGFEFEEVIVVTGSNLSGVTDRFSSSTSVSREDIELQGLVSVEDVVGTLPQNFGGSVSLDNSGGDNVNGSGSTGINLRGLGVESTLVLLNGRRVAAGGNRGNFVDVSAIPVAAIERVEVVADGASAIYGSDAVAGVVNFILRDDYEGAETQLNYDTVSDGGGGVLRVAQTLGFATDRANGMVSYQYSKTDSLDAVDKGFVPDEPQPNLLTPESEIHSLFASAGVELTDQLRLSGDLYYNDRRSTQTTSADFGFAVFTNDIEVESEQLGVTAALDYKWTENWSAELVGTYSESELTNDTFQLFFSGVASRPSTYENVSVDAIVRGKLASFSDESSQLAIGAHYRTEEVDRFIFFDSAVFGSFFTEQTDQSRDVTAIFAELYTPFVTEADGIPGVERLALTIALRHEDYDDVGSSTDPKIGLLWSPVAGFTVRGTYGTSFRAPSIFQVNDDYEALIANYLDPTTGMGVPAAELTGSTSDLDPEESESWSLGFDWSPEQIEGLSVSATYFNIDYDGRLGQARSFVNPDGLIDGFTGTPNRGVAAGELQALLNGATQVIQIGDVSTPPGPTIPLDSVAVVLDKRLINLQEARISGFDVALAYEVEVGAGRISSFINGTVLDRFDERLTSALPEEDRLDTFFEPNSLRLRAGVQWSHRVLTAGVYANHTGSYEDDRTGSDFSVDSWTTFDASMQFNLEQLFGSPLLDGTRVSVAVRNVANEDPPDIILGIPFDSRFFDATNSDPYGRRLGITVTKTW